MVGRFDLFSKRQADAAKAGQTEIYQYENVPVSLRRQVANIANRAFGADRQYLNRTWRENSNWLWVADTFAHERGIAPLHSGTNSGQKTREFMLIIDHSSALDVIELIAFKVNERYPRNSSFIDEINYRFRNVGLGYCFETSRLVRVDSEFAHAEIVKPALLLLNAPGFEGVQEEYLIAHQKYREGDNRQAVAMAANALESAFKAIFDRKGWEYNSKGRISDLARVAKAKGLWPDYMDNSFDQLLATLQSGLPKIRDNDASHGQGAEPKEVPSYIAAYALHLAASKIIFMVAAAG